MQENYLDKKLIYYTTFIYNDYVDLPYIDPAVTKG